MNSDMNSWVNSYLGVATCMPACSALFVNWVGLLYAFCVPTLTDLPAPPGVDPFCHLLFWVGRAGGCALHRPCACPFSFLTASLFFGGLLRCLAVSAAPLVPFFPSLCSPVVGASAASADLWGGRLGFPIRGGVSVRRAARCSVLVLAGLGLLARRLLRRVGDVAVALTY